MAYAQASHPADPAPQTVRIAGVRFRQAGKIYYFDPGHDTFSAGEPVVVETSEGLEMGEVVIPTKQVPADSVVLPLRPILRRAMADDERRLSENRELEARALKLAEERVRAHGLPMKLVSAEVAFDASRLRFLFVAEKRVDFRVLVKDLAAQFRARIELRQIGVRDQAKIVGGIGDCGRELCCTTWMEDFEPVSIRMAKLQNLSLSPSRLSGQCGRLKCCLKFENDVYREILKELPKIGTVVGTPHGRGKVVEVLVVKESVLVDLGEGHRVVVKGSELMDPELAPGPAPEESVNGSGSPSGVPDEQVAVGWDLADPVPETLLDEEEAQVVRELEALEDELAQEAREAQEPDKAVPSEASKGKGRSSGGRRRGRRSGRAKAEAGAKAETVAAQAAGAKEGVKEPQSRHGSRGATEKGGRGRQRQSQGGEQRPPQVHAAGQVQPSPEKGTLDPIAASADTGAGDAVAPGAGAGAQSPEHRSDNRPSGKRRRRRRRKGPQTDATASD